MDVTRWIDAVKDTAEFRRIDALPRRDLTPPKARRGLRPLQVLSLDDIQRYGGAFLSLPVGAGKTLIGFEALRGAARGVYLCEGGAAKEMVRRWNEYPEGEVRPTFMSYEWLARANNATALGSFRPDVIVADEAHRLKNPRGSCAQRINRYLRANPDTVFIAMTATPMLHSIRDFAHLLRWCLPPELNPLPNQWLELDAWARATDAKLGLKSRAKPGALAQWCDTPSPTLAEVREAVGRRIRETPGVVWSSESSCDAEIKIKLLRVLMPESVGKALEKLDKDWVLPDGTLALGPTDRWRKLRQLSWGFYSAWASPPPRKWLQARQDWARYVRLKTGTASKYDTKGQVEYACRNGRLKSSEYDAWHAVKGEYSAKTEVRWVSTEIVDSMSKILTYEPNWLVWAEDRALGHHFAAKAQVPYYASKGRCQAPGNWPDTIEEAAGIQAVASVKACGTARRLQAWATNYVLSCPPNDSAWEQLIGRTHRDGQRAKTVEVNVLCPSVHMVEQFAAALDSARHQKQVSSKPRKLLAAEIDVRDIPPKWRKKVKL